MKKILSFSVGLILIGNFLSAQAVGSFISVAPGGDWNALSTWQQGNGVGFVPATSYPGENPGTGVVTIALGSTVTLNVSPVNPIGSLVFVIGGNSETLNISDGFTLNVTGAVLIVGAQSAGAQTKTLSLNGPNAVLNAGSITITPGNQAARFATLQFNGGGTVNVTGNLAMGTGADALTTRIIFSGAAGGTLNVNGNLTGAGLITTTATGTSTINVLGTASAGTVTMNNAAAILQLNANTTVSGTLTLTNGKINIGASTLTLSNPTPATQLSTGSATSYVYATSGTGRLIRQNLAAATNYTFPVGTPTDYLPVIVNTAAGVSSFAVSAYSPATRESTVGGTPFDAATLLRIVNAMWYIDRPVGTGASTLTLQWVAGLEGTTFSGLANTQFGISRHDGTSWAFPPIQNPGTGNNATNVVAATFTTFGVFGVADIGQALPVKFGAIKAYEKLNGIQLDWNVYSENKVRSYEVERSADGRSYTSVGSLPALFNNTSDGAYGFFDANPLSGTSYYRIKNNDLDGKSAYSIVVRVNRNKTIKGLSLYPNPIANGTVLLQGSDLGRGNYKLNIFGSNGQEIFKQQIKHNGGTITHTIELPSSISKGVYMFSVKDENGNIIFKEKLVNQ